MADNAPPAAPAISMTPEEEMQAEAEVQMRDIGQRFSAIPEDQEELLRLLEEAAYWLSKVDQTPPESMYNALRPTMAVLITNELLEHPDPNVKVALTSCLTEVTRITAEEDCPYDDDAMKVVFKRVVETFGDLDDMNCPSYARRVSILDTFAKVRCCLLMLDLELDDMILDMFHHFFKTASTRHSEKVTNCMENIMMFVIQESDVVHAELASCLLQNLTKEAQETLPASFRLVERVLGLCKDKLKPVLHELLKGTPLDDYSNVVTMLFQDTSDAEENNVVASGKDMEMVSPTKIDKSEGQQEDSGASLKRKRLMEAQETSLSKKNKMLDENLIGSRIKVWWPEDKMFYPGVVASYEASSKKHKVSYDDGDVEVLVLKKERWEFIAEEQDIDPDASSNIRRGRKAKGSSGQQRKEGKKRTPQSDVKNPPKKRGHPKGVRSSNNKPNADSSVTPVSLKGKIAEKDAQETPKIGSNSKKKGEPSQSTGKAKDAVVKASSKDAPDSTDNSKDDASSEDRKKRRRN